MIDNIPTITKPNERRRIMKYVNHVELEMTAEELRACRNVGQNLLDILARATEPRIYNEQNDDDDDDSDMRGEE